MRVSVQLLRWSLGAFCVGLALALATVSPAMGVQRVASGPVQGRIGDLTVVDAFLPQPASPDVAAIYLTVCNSGGSPDALVAVTSPNAHSSMLMTENSNGTMGMLTELRIPAHGQASLVPGHDHLMLEQPHGALQLGDHVTVNLRFRRAGSLTIRVPIVPLSRILTRGD